MPCAYACVAIPPPLPQVAEQGVSDKAQDLPKTESARRRPCHKPSRFKDLVSDNCLRSFVEASRFSVVLSSASLFVRLSAVSLFVCLSTVTFFVCLSAVTFVSFASLLFRFCVSLYRPAFHLPLQEVCHAHPETWQTTPASDCAFPNPKKTWGGGESP